MITSECKRRLLWAQLPSSGRASCSFSGRASFSSSVLALLAPVRAAALRLGERSERKRRLLWAQLLFLEASKLLFLGARKLLFICSRFARPCPRRSSPSGRAKRAQTKASVGAAALPRFSLCSPLSAPQLSVLGSLCSPPSAPQLSLCARFARPCRRRSSPSALSSLARPLHSQPRLPCAPGTRQPTRATATWAPP
jgi:hypothetical protein